MARVRVRGPLKQLAGGCGNHDVSGTTVRQLLDAFERANPAVGGWILDERGLVRRHINVFLNGDQVTEDTAVGPDDQIEILPAISGG